MIYYTGICCVAIHLIHSTLVVYRQNINNTIVFYLCTLLYADKLCNLTMQPTMVLARSDWLGPA